MRHRVVLLLTAAFVLAAQPAWAASATTGISGLQWGAEIVSLALAAVLLGYVFALAKVADGSAIAENINLVAAAVVCLAASVLAGWGSRFMPDALTQDQARLASQLLVIVTIVLFTVYIARVRLALLRFLKSATQTEELLAASQVGLDQETPDLAVPETSDLPVPEEA